MNAIERVATFMQDNDLKLVTAESCTAGLIAATLADIPGAGQLLDCAFVVYSVEAKQRCLGVPQSTLDSHNLTSEAVARDMALGAARKSPANVAVANTGVTDATDDRIPSGTQCYAWVFKMGQADARPVVFTATKRFSGDRNSIRKASAEYALQGVVEHYRALREGGAEATGRKDSGK